MGSTLSKLKLLYLRASDHRQAVEAFDLAVAAALRDGKSLGQIARIIARVDNRGSDTATLTEVFDSARSTALRLTRQHGTLRALTLDPDDRQRTPNSGFENVSMPSR